MAKPARKVTARSDNGGAFLPTAPVRIQRGMRVTLRNVKLPSGELIDIPGYVRSVANRIATVDTWGVTRPLTLPVARLRTMTGGGL